MKIQYYNLPTSRLLLARTSAPTIHATPAPNGPGNALSVDGTQGHIPLEDSYAA